MRLPETAPKNEQENLLPLVNVVFLLLIFFMVAGAFTKPEVFSIDPVIANTEINAETNTLTVIMNIDGKLAIEDEIVSSEQLISVIQSYMQENSQQTVHLKVDANADAIHIVELLAILAETDLQAIHLLTSNQ